MHRRRSTRDWEEASNGREPSLLGTFIGYITDRMARSAMKRVRRGTRDVVRWTVPRLIGGWIGASLISGGIFFTLGAGLKGLEALRCPVWLAYLCTGFFAILVALVSLKGLLWPGAERGEDD